MIDSKVKIELGDCDYRVYMDGDRLMYEAPYRLAPHQYLPPKATCEEDTCHICDQLRIIYHQANKSFEGM